jgi:tetratricopeptide (TPR) repeat protein
MKQIVLIVIVLAAAAGCQTTKLEDSKAQAQKRWFHTRAQMVLGVAVEQLKNGQLDKAASKAQEALALDGDLEEARVLLGKVYVEQGEYAAAIVELHKASDRQPMAAEPLYLTAVAEERSGQLQLALEHYRRSQALDPNNLEPVKAAAEVMIQLNRAAEARLYLENYISSASSDPGMYELAGRLAMIERDYAKASGYYQRAHSLDAANRRYREALGEAQVLNHEYAEAAETFGDLLADKSYKPNSIFLCRLGECHLALNKPLLARDDFFQASELAPEVAGVWVGLSKSALAGGDAARAILSARKALELEPQNADAVVLLGYALLRDGQNQAALSVLETSAKARPEDSTLQCVLGRAYAANGNADRATTCYRQALRLDPQNPLARDLAGGAVNLRAQ